MGQRITEPVVRRPRGEPRAAEAGAAAACDTPAHDSELPLQLTPQGSAVPELTARDRQRSIAWEEHVATVHRMRKGMLYGVVIWGAFFITDWAVVRFIEPGSLWWYFGLRGTVFVTSALAAWTVHRTPIVSPRTLWLADFFGYTAGSVAITLMSLEFRGLFSPYSAGIVTVLICRAIISPENWKRAVFLLGGPAFAYPVTLVIASFFSPALAAQFRDPKAVATLGLSMAFILAAYGFMLIGGHSVWALRRQVFEARNVGRYKLKRNIGSGGMGEVWVAHHSAMRRDVAIKILRPDRNKDETSAVARFEREVRATAELTHPNTVRIFDYGATDDGLWYYAMELLQGEDLATLVERSGPLEPARAACLVEQAARALAEAHAHGIVHRDVKPENLFLNNSGTVDEQVKVLDFGIAQVARHEGDATLTGTGLMLGTPQYLSPEAASGRPTTPASDIYALGCVLYFLLTGTPPHEGKNSGALVFAHLNVEPVAPSLRRETPLPDGLDGVVLRCLHKSPTQRFASMAELADALAPFAGRG